MEPQLMGQKFQLALNLSLKVIILVLCYLWGPGISYAASPTAAQIEQFKQLPKADQDRLAREFGINVSDTMGTSIESSGLGSDNVDQPRATVPTYNPAEDVSPDNELKPSVKTLKKYGYDLFANNGVAFIPDADIPVPDNYVLGPGDALFVQLYGKENDSYNFTLSREGQIHFPKIGPLNLAGLTFTQVQNHINQTVSEQMIGVKSAVTMGAVRSIRVFVLGEAVQPGS